MLNKLLVIMLAATTAAAAHAAPRTPPAGSVAISHHVLRNGVHVAVVNEQFENRDGRYHIVSESVPVGLLALVQPRPATLTSTGRITENGLQPERFEGGRGAGDARRVNAEFDWAGAKLSLTHDGRSERVDLPAGTQDRLSIMYQFMFFSYGERREIDFAMTNGRKLDHYRYAITRDVEIDTPLGRMTTLHLVKQREPGDSETEIWLAPLHRYLPVRMLIVESDGARYEQAATRLEVQP
jgi:hypothetical protein